MTLNARELNAFISASCWQWGRRPRPARQVRFYRRWCRYILDLTGNACTALPGARPHSRGRTPAGQVRVSMTSRAGPSAGARLLAVRWRSGEEGRGHEQHLVDDVLEHGG